MNTFITTVNPATGEMLSQYQTMTAEQIENSVASGHKTANQWKMVPIESRVEVVRQLAAVLRKNSAELSELITLEMGKPISEAQGEVEKSAITALYYADNASKFLTDEPADINGINAWVSYEAIGLILAIMPWNFPIWQVMRFAIPAVTAGNAVLLKHSPNVTGSALAMQKIFAEAGFPENLFTTLVVAECDVPSTIDRLISDDRVVAVTLTGSNRAGAAVGAAAGRESKKSVLELGGSDAFIVLDDADVEKAAETAVKARFNNAGQSCVCAKRFIVSSSIAEEFTKLFVDKVRKLTVGDPRDSLTLVGPLARSDLREALHGQVIRSVEAGAMLLTGGNSIDAPGYFYEPTVLANVAPGMAAFDEETFGPVAAITIADSDFHAIELANATQFGLSVSIWTENADRGVRVAKQITSGAAFINAATASDARVPFGGTKKSGYGRELSGVGMREFTNIRTYWVA